MKKFTSLLIFCIFLLPNLSFTQTDDLPFSIELEDISFDNWEGLHSFAFAEWNDLWIFVGGRTNGLHGFFLATGFPVSSANDAIFVMDPSTGEVWTYDVNLLTDRLTEVLRATNGQYIQSGNFLYITGGYGKSIITDKFVTFPTLTSIQLDILVPAIINGTSASHAFQQITDTRLQVCGGEMLALGGDFYLVGGNDFSGRYSDDESEFIQVYTNEIRKFNINNQDGILSISNYTAFSGSAEYHRRDFSLAPVIFPDNSEGLAVYGGVFRPDAPLPYEHPIYISENDIQIDESYSQKMSHYTCPVIPLYDAEDQNMYSIFFGGLSWNYYDHENDEFIQDDLVPFIDDITTFVKRADGTSTEIVLPVQFNDFLGSNAKFILNSDVPHHDNKVIKLEEITERTLLGYIFGGIKAQFRNFTPSSASKRLFAVYLTPTISSKVSSPIPQTLKLLIIPNPSSDKVEVKLSQKINIQHFSQLEISDMYGRVVQQKPLRSSSDLFIDIRQFPKGIYQVKLKGVEQIIGVGRFLKM